MFKLGWGLAPVVLACSACAPSVNAAPINQASAAQHNVVNTCQWSKPRCAVKAKATKQSQATTNETLPVQDRCLWMKARCRKP